MNYDELIEDIHTEIEKNLKPKRFVHSKNVAEKAVELAKKYNVNEKKAEFAALAHDRFRDIDDVKLNKLIDDYKIDNKYRDNNALGHGWVAAKYINDKYNISDDDIINSVRFHTTGRKDMCVLEKIIFLADAIEKARIYPGVDKIRIQAEKGLDHGVEESLKNTVHYLNEKNKIIDKDTIEALQYIKSCNND